MPNRLPTRDPIGKELRRSNAERRVGPGSKCAYCGEPRPEALIARSHPMICAECRRKQRGHSTLDGHHPAGEANHKLTIPVPVKDHRAILTPAMYDWPKQTRENPNGAPLLAAAACIRGFCDTVIYLINKLIYWIAEFLEALHEKLVCEYGEHYWLVLNIGFTVPQR